MQIKNTIKRFYHPLKMARIFSTDTYSTGFLGFVDRLRMGFGRIEMILLILSIVLAIIGLVCSLASTQPTNPEKYSMQELHQTRLKYGIAKGMSRGFNRELSHNDP